MQRLYSQFYEKYALVQTSQVRNFINTIDWDNRFIGIKGSRGVGKTTLLLQYIRLNFKPDKSVLYISLDNLYFLENNFYDLVDDFYKKGGQFIAIDEVHKYANWALEIKNIYDNMPNLKLVFTGSSLLHIHQAKADLSRRVVVYDMPGLSFREFLQFETNINFNCYSLHEIVENHVGISIEITQKVKPLQHFSNYLNYGYYPFYLDNKRAFHQKLSEVILTVLEIDIPQYALIQTANIVMLKKLLAVISNAVPFKPNMNSISERTGISLNTMKNYLKLLNEAQLLNLLYVEDKGINSLGKPEKIYLNNSNLMYNLGKEADIGSIRETFFFNQLQQVSSVHAEQQVDFKVKEGYMFELGGRNKKPHQILNKEATFLVKDDIEIGTDLNIPLWLFGFLY
ncbi:ATP-binding protein [Flavobacterium nackdongense]|uniref:AAA family ATPase n=1 Tax=Flavobacterium nackdongense TaxID=2547394 RepID=A0A4P6YGY8_9FLAO|nr:AAA family ATPase [Flavobacterium nackdongense]QBN19840.1 AAA family ATPase [Flavobacterium nackdongense]